MEENRIETRNRSRSKTPFLRSSCDNEQCSHLGEEGEGGHLNHPHHHGDKKKKSSVAPNVQSISEETVEVTSSLSPSKKTSNSESAMQQPKAKTSDAEPQVKVKKINATTAKETQERKQTSSLSTSSTSSTTTTTTTTKIMTKSQKQLENNNIATHATAVGRSKTSTPKTINIQESFAAQFTSSRNGEGSNGIFSHSSRPTDLSLRDESNNNSTFNRSKRLHSNANNSGKSISNIIYSVDTSSNIDLNDHIAYKEYKEAGEYWKKYPKTDYTYSELSPHRREVVPGVIAMPNMSRQSLEKHNERINYMISRNPDKEEYIRRRYDWSFYRSKQTKNTNAADNLIYDSQDELDMAQLRVLNRKRFMKLSSETWLTRIIEFFMEKVTSCRNMMSDGGREYTDDSGYYGTKITQTKQGFFGTIASGFLSAILTVFQYIYLFISTVLCLDTWLLQSTNVENKNKKRFLLVLLILLPFLLLAAWSQLAVNDRIALVQRIQNLLPLALINSLRVSFSGAANELKDIISFIPSIQLGSSHDITGNLQKSLTADEYQNILKHVDSYIEKLVNIKIEEKRKESTFSQITPELSLTIANSVRENINKMSENLHWNDEDIQKIAMLIEQKLELGKWVNHQEQQQAHYSEVKNHNYYNNIDLDELLARILESPKMSKFVDSKIVASQQENLNSKTSILIEELNKEIEFIKLALSDKLSENQDLQLSISNLQHSQMDLEKRIAQHELETGHRLNSFLSEIEEKLSTLRDEQFALLNRQIKISLVEILGFRKSADSATNGNLNIDDIDLQNWMRNMFVAKEFLQQKLIELNSQINSDVKNDLDRSAAILMRNISEQLKKEILQLFEQKQKELDAAENIRLTISEEEIKRIVKNVLAVYDADKTGLVDFALESAGGQILSTRCTENYHTKSAQISVFGIPLWYPSNTPRIAISPNVQPGECWAFQGFPGFLGFTLEHIPKSLAPNGRIDSAPRNFTVWGLEDEKDQNPILFGEYHYDDNNSSLQYFPVQNANAMQRPYDIVELRIETNHGHSRYTCLYRFRVHGKPPEMF